jgi:hypothetical protein
MKAIVLKKQILKIFILSLILFGAWRLCLGTWCDFRKVLSEGLTHFGGQLEIRRSNKNIFFTETSFNSEDGSFVMNARSACSIESAALMNPDNSINVLFTAKKPLQEGLIQ